MDQDSFNLNLFPDFSENLISCKQYSNDSLEYFEKGNYSNNNLKFNKNELFKERKYIKLYFNESISLYIFIYCNLNFFDNYDKIKNNNQKMINISNEKKKISNKKEMIFKINFFQINIYILIIYH